MKRKPEFIYLVFTFGFGFGFLTNPNLGWKQVHKRPPPSVQRNLLP